MKRLNQVSRKITEIIPEEIFNDPDLEWAKIAFEEGNFFNVVVERIRNMKSEIMDLDTYLCNVIKHNDELTENYAGLRRKLLEIEKEKAEP